jgi:uncharacterized membrane protein
MTPLMYVLIILALAIFIVIHVIDDARNRKIAILICVVVALLYLLADYNGLRFYR